MEEESRKGSYKSLKPGVGGGTSRLSEDPGGAGGGSWPQIMSVILVGEEGAVSPEVVSGGKKWVSCSRNMTDGVIVQKVR